VSRFHERTAFKTNALNLFTWGLYTHWRTMNTLLTNYIVFYENTPDTPLVLAAHSPLNAAKDFVLQNKAGTSDAAVVVRAEANPSDTKKFQKTGGSWSQIPAPEVKAATSTAPHLPTSSHARGGRIVQIKSVSIYFSALYGCVAYCLVWLVSVVISAITLGAEFATLMTSGILIAILMGAVAGALGALFYNVTAAMMGGLRVELADDI
jgi:hypothetical protein